MKIKKWSMLLMAVLFCWSVSAYATTPRQVKVGVVTSLTGHFARAGNGPYEGMKVATEVFNQTHPGLRITLLAKDDESDPGKAISEVEHLASDNVVAVMGGATSAIVAPALATANKLGMVYVTSGGTSSEFIKQGYNKFFRINNTQGYVTAMTGFFKTLGVNNLSVVYSTSKSTYELAQMVKTIMEKAGTKVHMHSFDPKIRDFKPLVNKIKHQDKPDVINVLGYENDYIGFLRAARVLRPDVKAIVGGWQIANAKMANDFPSLVKRVSGTEMLPYPVTFKSKDGKAFEQRFMKAYGRSPDYLNEYGYVVATLLFEAIERAVNQHTLKTDDGLANQMRATDRQTLIGRVEFNAQGDNPHFMPNIGQHQGNKVEIVWPADAATEKLQLPGVPW